MSLAIVGFNRDSGFAISDMRCSRLHEDGSCTPWSEDEPKVFQISPSMLVAATGTLHFCRAVRDAVPGSLTFEDAARRVERIERGEGICHAILLAAEGGVMRCALWNSARGFRREIVPPTTGELPVLVAIGIGKAQHEVLRCAWRGVPFWDVPRVLIARLKEIAPSCPEINDRTKFCCINPRATFQSFGPAAPRSAHFDLSTLTASDFNLDCISDETTTITGFDGVARSRIRVNWTPPDDAFVLSGGFIEIWVIDHASLKWYVAGRVDGGDSVFYLDGVQDGLTYNFKLRAVNSHGAQSAFTGEAWIVAAGSGSFPNSTALELENPRFETDTGLPPYGWEVDPTWETPLLSYDTSTPWQGARSVAVRGYSGLQHYLRTKRTFLVQPGDKLGLSAATKNVDDGGGKIEIVFYNYSGSEIGSGHCLVTSTSWQVDETGVVTAPSGTYSARVRIGVDGTGHASGTGCEFDSLRLFKIIDLAANEVSGVLPGANLPNPAASTLGGVKSKSADSHKFLTAIGTDGSVSNAQPGFSDLSGTAATSQLPARTASLSFVIDGGGSVVTTGSKGVLHVPAACTVTGWVLTADASGSAVVDVKRATYSGFPSTSSIAGTDKPTLSSAQKNENTGPLSSWGSTALAAGDVLEFNVDSCTTCKRLTVTLLLSVPA